MADRMLKREEAHKILVEHMENALLHITAAVGAEGKKGREDLEWKDIARLQLALKVMADLFRLITDPTCVEVVVTGGDNTTPTKAQVPAAQLAEEQKKAFGEWFVAAMKVVSDNLGIEATEQLKQEAFVDYFQKGATPEDAVFAVLADGE